MVRLSVDLFNDASQYINSVRERELNLRGFKIPAIENMGVTKDQFDVIDFTDNDIKRLDNFPLLKRLHTLYLHNNRVQVIQSDIAEKLPNLKTLALTNNNICELGDLDPLAKCEKLEYVTFLGNPIVHLTNYRSYVIWKLPTVRVIDFKRVRQAEREKAKEIFKGKRGKKAREAIKKTNVVEAPNKENEGRGGTALTTEDRASIQEAINAAKSLQEVEYLQSILASGRVPEKGWNKQLDLVPETNAQAVADANGFVPETENEEMET